MGHFCYGENEKLKESWKRKKQKALPVLAGCSFWVICWIIIKKMEYENKTQNFTLPFFIFYFNED